MSANHDSNFDGLFDQLKNMSGKLKKSKADNKHLKLNASQQKSFLKLNSLLEKSTQSLVCGPDCQKDKKAEKLKQKYLKAETNIQTAPGLLDESRKNYYVFTEGEPYYDDMLEKELTDNAALLARQLFDEFRQELEHCDTLNAYYQGALVGQEHMDELYASYLEKSIHLRNKTQGTQGEVLTNMRKTYYQNEEITSLTKWGKMWFYLYFFLVFFLFICAAMKSEKNVKGFAGLFIKFGLLVAYPFFSYGLINWVWSWIAFFIHMFPKNVYADIH